MGSRRMWVSIARVADYDGSVIATLFGGPNAKLTVTPSSPIPMADPKPLFWVTGIVLGLLAAWVLYVVFTHENRKAPSAQPESRGDGAQ